MLIRHLSQYYYINELKPSLETSALQKIHFLWLFPIKSYPICCFSWKLIWFKTTSFAESSLNSLSILSLIFYVNQGSTKISNVPTTLFLLFSTDVTIRVGSQNNTLLDISMVTLWYVSHKTLTKHSTCISQVHKLNRSAAGCTQCILVVHSRLNCSRDHLSDKPIFTGEIVFNTSSFTNIIADFKRHVSSLLSE